MQITHHLTANDTIRQLTNEENHLGQQVLQTNMGFKPEESLLIVTDPQMLQKEAAIWFETGKTITEDTQLICFEGMTQNAQEPPKEVSIAMRQADVAMLQTSFSLSHTKARLEASKSGARIASLPSVTHDIILRTLAIDYQPIAQLSIKLADHLSNANTAHITAANGTDLTIALTDRAGLDDTGYFTTAGDFGNLPAGEAFIAPPEETAQGVYVVDGSFADITLDQPITITIENGYATNIYGGQAAKQLNHQLNKTGKKSRNLAELGIGTNPEANPTGSLIEAEKAYGTVHLALGNNATIGGKVDVPFHSDGVILSPTLTLDGNTILRDGGFTFNS